MASKKTIPKRNVASYYLWKAALGQKPKVTLTKAEYLKILTAWKGILALVNIEEEWDCLVQNYLELEMELLRSAMDSMIVGPESFHDMQQSRLGFARRLSNLLSSSRSYLDHIPHHLASVKNGKFRSHFVKLTNTAYESHFAYRFMEALRNYAQHRGLPLHGSTFDSSWIDPKNPVENQSSLRYSVAASVNLDKLRLDQNFKKTVLKELDPALENQDISPMVREYLEALGGVHDGLRELLEADLTGWKKTIRDAINRYSDLNKGDVLGLSVAEFSSDGSLKNYNGIFEELLTRIDRLKLRNGSMINLRRRYVSNEILPGKKYRSKR